MTLFDMKGKVAVITGSTRGIGRAIAERMAEHGAKVVVSSRKQDVCDQVTKEINDTFGNGTAVAKAEAIFRRCKGWKSFELHRSIEKPSRYRLHIRWETLENHTVDFRGSENFAEWRALVGPHFASAPEVEHTNTVTRF